MDELARRYLKAFYSGEVARLADFRQLAEPVLLEHLLVERRLGSDWAVRVSAETFRLIAGQQHDRHKRLQQGEDLLRWLFALARSAEERLR